MEYRIHRNKLRDPHASRCTLHTPFPQSSIALTLGPELDITMLLVDMNED